MDMSKDAIAPSGGTIIAVYREFARIVLQRFGRDLDHPGIENLLKNIEMGSVDAATCVEENFVQKSEESESESEDEMDKAGRLMEFDIL
jgi:hypothetical protein